MENENLEHSRDKYYKVGVIFIVLAVIATIVGSTFAYWSWQSSEAQKTAVTFTVTAGFSCSADGGGNIAPGDVGLAPASCTNSTYAIKRTVTVSPTITNADGGIYMDLWLKVNSIGSGLANSQNFKYALTTSSSNCTTGVVAQGNFNGATTNTQKTLLHNKAYATTTNETYYLWIWLDAAETSPDTMNQTFSMELGGVCTNQAPNEQTVYTVNLYDENATNYNSVMIGSPVANNITTYNSPDAAITALETSYSTLNNGATASLPFFLKHTVGDGSFWCASGAEGTACIFESQAECNANVSSMFGSGFTCQENTFTGGVTESYVGFVVTPTMAANNSGMTAGTYYLKGGDFGRSFLANAKTIYDAFGGVGCYSDGTAISTPYSASYNPNPSSYFNCRVSGLNANAGSYGNVDAGDSAGSNCRVDIGCSDCVVSVDDGGGVN